MAHVQFMYEAGDVYIQRWLYDHASQAKLMPLQHQLTFWSVRGRHNSSNWWDNGFRYSPCCNFLGKDASLTRCCWLPLWGKKKTLVTDIPYPILFSTSLYQGHWNKEIKENCLISKGHNPSPQKKQGTIGAQVLKSNRPGLDFQLFYLLDVLYWTNHLSFGWGLSFLIWKNENNVTYLTRLLWGLKKVMYIKCLVWCYFINRIVYH